MTDLIKRLRLQSEHIPVRTLFDDAADRIEELTLQLLATSGQAADALDKAVVAEAKLTKALEERDEYKAAAEICGKAARAMLAELEKTE